MAWNRRSGVRCSLFPGARAVEFGQGTQALALRGSDHHGGWYPTDNGPELRTEVAEGALGGMASASDLIVRLTLKPPSSIPQPMPTVDLTTGEASTLSVKGRHDPVLAPEASRWSKPSRPWW